MELESSLLACSDSATEPSAASAPSLDTRTFEVLLHRRAGVEAALVLLAKRAVRKGLVPLAWSWGKPYTQRESVVREGGVTHRFESTRIQLRLEARVPRYAGWRFVAALQHLDGENVIRSVEGSEVPATYRTRGPVCDHCRHNRRRSETYVLKHDDGRMVQVGSTCLADFLGSDDAGKLAAMAELLSCATSSAEDGCEGFGEGARSDFALSELLPVVAFLVRKDGFVSRGQARESVTPTTSTADRTWRYLTDSEAAKRDKVEPEAEDGETAAAAELWAESLTDAEVEASRGDYLHNLRAIARSGLVSHKLVGLAASVVVAYQRAVGRERARAERDARPEFDAHVGTIGKREVFQVVLEFVTGYATDYGYTTVCKFRTAEGALLVWKATGDAGVERDDVGKRYALKGTVKKHDEYKGKKQTLLSRCVVEEVKS